MKIMLGWFCSMSVGISSSNAGEQKYSGFYNLMLFLVTLFYSGLQLAGVVAVEVTGGPTIDFVPGRKVQKDEDMPSFSVIKL